MTTGSNSSSGNQNSGAQPSQQQKPILTPDVKPQIPPLESVRHYIIVPEKKPQSNVDSDV